MAVSNAAEGGRVFGASVIETYPMGMGVDLYAPTPEQIQVEDVANALGNQCRYGGHVRRFYSVAEHSVLVARLIPHLPQARLHYPRDEGAWPLGFQLVLQKAALLHDVSETYLQDLTSPLKWTIREVATDLEHERTKIDPYGALSVRMDEVVCAAFGTLERDLDSEHVKLADLWALRIEAAVLTRSGGKHWRWPEEVLALGGLPVGVPWVGGLQPAEAGEHFLREFNLLFNADVKLSLS